jgi:DNA repair exonuclease SbcCD ATPase subunit
MEEETIQLENRGYVLVNGINKDARDNAKSNGSGKSTIWNAICWALTGATIAGVSKDLPNREFNDGCWVSLEFTVDKDVYTITRYKDDAKFKTNLKISVNGEDKSGKGIRESEELLHKLLPEITGDILGSVVVLGQGLPCRFSNNTPSGRKLILEQLSKSDYLIQEVKDKLSTRHKELDSKVSELNEQLIKNSSSKSIHESRLNHYLEEKNKKVDVESLSNIVKDYESQLIELDTKYNSLVSDGNLLTKDIEKLDLDRDSLKDKRYQVVLDVKSQFSSKNNELSTELSNMKNDKVKYESEIQSLNRETLRLNSEIKKLNSISGVCPTCGKPLDGFVKPSTKEQETRLGEISTEIEELTSKITNLNTNISETTKSIRELEQQLVEETNKATSSVDVEITTLDKNKAELISKRNDIAKSLDEIDSSTRVIERKKISVEGEIDAYVKLQATIDSEIDSCNKAIDECNANIETITKSKDDLDEHLAVVNKLETLVKRDFRGYLLLGLIEYIDKVAKRYSRYIFNHDNIEFYLSGNNIEIELLNKPYENLSGGEQRKVDLIIQLALRDMLSKYLNIQFNMLVLDEIFDNLDAKGSQALCDFLSSEQLAEIDSVFIVSHHTDELSIPHDSILNVCKEPNGISHII